MNNNKFSVILHVGSEEDSMYTNLILSNEGREFVFDRPCVGEILCQNIAQGVTLQL